MTVHPGFGGQSFRPEMMEKVRESARMAIKATKLPIRNRSGWWNQFGDRQDYAIENGANVLVAGTSIFRAKDYRQAISELRG